MIWSNNIITVFTMCILFLCAFRILEYASSKSTKYTIVEGNENPISVVFPPAKIADATHIQSKIDTVNKLIEQFTELQNKLNSNTPILSVTTSYKTSDNSDLTNNAEKSLDSSTVILPDQNFEISISGEPLSQTIHVTIPVGARGSPGPRGDPGDMGNHGLRGDKGAVGNTGIATCK
jgi:hypothetical protein